MSLENWQVVDDIDWVELIFDVADALSSMSLENRQTVSVEMNLSIFSSVDRRQWIVVSELLSADRHRWVVVVGYKTEKNSKRNRYGRSYPPFRRSICIPKHDAVSGGTNDTDDFADEIVEYEVNESEKERFR